MHFTPQTFAWIDLLIVCILFALEVTLSADNAAALAVIVRNLPENKRNKALFIGIVSSFILRGGAILVTAYFIQFLWIQVAGGIYLIFLAFTHYKESTVYQIKVRPMWLTVVIIECTDLVFALDSIIAAVAVLGIYYSTDLLSSKLWIIYLGGVLGMVGMRFMTKGVLYLMERYPKIEKIVFICVALLGLRLVIHGLTPTIKSFFM